MRGVSPARFARGLLRKAQKLLIKACLRNFDELGSSRLLNAEKPVILTDNGLHKTGNNLLSHDSGVVLPSAAESLTSVFEMGTCVSSRL